MKVSVIVGKTPTHQPKKVRCNGQEYLIPFPIEPHNFLQIVEVLQISSANEVTLQILSKNKNQVNSVQEFYKIQSQCTMLFGVDIAINHLAVALSILSQTELAIKQLDQLTLKDLFLVFKQGYDGLTSRTHSKLERRLKKYLAQTLRPQSEKQQISKYVHVIRAQSTDEEVDIKQEKVEKIAEKPPPKTKKMEEGPQQNSKEFLSELEKHEHESQIPEKVSKHHRKHHHGHRKSQDQEADWQDIEEEKLNKKMQKKSKKKRLLEDVKAEEGTQSRKERKVYDDRKIFKSYKEKQEKDMKVPLGILGDTDQGWRERYRITRIPQQQ